MELVHSNNGNAHGGAYNDNVQSDRLRRMRPSRKGDNKIKSLVPSDFLQTDITNVTDSTGIFTNMMFCILRLLFCLFSYIDMLTIFHEYLA